MALKCLLACWLLSILSFSFSIAHAQSLASAQALYQKGDSKKALDEIQRLLQKNSNSDVLLLQAEVLTKLKRADEAIAVYQQVIDTEPSRLEAYNNLAALHAQKNELELASNILEKAMRHDPIYATLYDNLQAVYWSRSQQHARAALKLKPERVKLKLAALENKKSIESSSLQSTEPAGAKQVRQAVLSWAAAWSARDVQKYVSSYDLIYAPNGKTRAEWIANRQADFQSRTNIKVTISQLSIIAVNEQYIAKFVQEYNSDQHRDKALKELGFIKDQNEWKINQETTLKAL